MAAGRQGMTTLSGVFLKDTLVDGRPSRIQCLNIAGQTFTLTRGAATRVGLEDDWYEDVHDPREVIAALRHGAAKTDIFTFWQRPPQTEPRFDYHKEWESIAVLRVTTFDQWWSRQIKPETRNLVRKAEKKGVEVREAKYDDEFVRGMTAIFNETPIRQGRPFWHYGKDFETVRQQFSRFIFREHLLGAYHEGELIGFVMLGDAGRFGVIGQIISKLQHRDKSPNNALIAKAVEVCERSRLAHLAYAYWGDGPLVSFKRHNGFQEMRLPRYYVPLTRRGQLAISLGLHRGWKALLPTRVKARLRAMRSGWLNRAAHA
jgi:hypothetical protein